jgi:hypothetical protein
VQGRFCPKRQKWTENFAALNSSLNLKRPWAIFTFWPNWSCSSVREQILTLLGHPTYFQLSAENPRSLPFSYRYNLVLLTRLRHVSICSKPDEIAYDVGFQCLLSSHFESGQHFDLPKSVHSLQTRIFSSHWQLSEIITPQSLVRLRHMGNRWKAEKDRYEVGIQYFLIWHSKWGQKFWFPRTISSVHNGVSAARFNFQKS